MTSGLTCVHTEADCRDDKHVAHDLNGPGLARVRLPESHESRCYGPEGHRHREPVEESSLIGEERLGLDASDSVWRLYRRTACADFLERSHLRAARQRSSKLGEARGC